jgi:uncharacterized protein (TIGR00269 family)
MSICGCCGRSEVFFVRAYSGECLCRSCFVSSVQAKVRATIGRFGMFRFDDRVAVAVSGGKDSTSLLCVLAGLERCFPRAELVGVSVDEGIKGYRDEALVIARDSCRKLGVEHVVVGFEELFGSGLDDLVVRLKASGEGFASVCAFCGVLRRRALNLAARKVGADKLATGHTLDDEVETVLLNVFRGDVWRLAKEKPVSDFVSEKLVPRVKPFCLVPEREVALYAFVKGIRFQSSACPYAAGAFRNDARAMINAMEEKHAGVKFAVSGSFEKLRPFLDGLVRREGLRECSVCGELTTGEVCRVCGMLRELGFRISGC